ncbi:short-chain dehydrogenase/reductase [Aspergillus heterothallicus]
MASIAAVRENNAGITRLYGSGLVAVFVGGTSGIGESTARAFVRNTDASRAYLIGRDEARAMGIIEELRQLKPDSQVTFIKSDVSLLREVDRACSAIQEKEEKVNILFLSPGTESMNGRDETDEGLDKKLNLHYYSRLRFVSNLLPQLSKAADTTQPTNGSNINNPRLSRVISVLEAGGEAALHLDDLSLKTNWSLRNCGKHAITMNSVAMEHLASIHPQTSFIHTFPGIIRTGLNRDLGTTAKCAISALMVLAKPWEIPFEESGERHLFAATSTRFSPRADRDQYLRVAEGSDGSVGSGFYRVASDGSTYKLSKIMEKYRVEGMRSMIWDHTLNIFAQVRGGRQNKA